jgi:hypothetical protein
VKVQLHWQGGRAEFRYPIQPVQRTAVLTPWFTSRRGPVRIFENGWSEEAARFAPAAIAATWTQMQELAADPLSSSRSPDMPVGMPPAPTHALIVLHRAGEVPLTAEDREWLWRKFGVPIFEQVIGARGELWAAECEAHDGMHIESPEMESNGTSLGGQVDASACACGRTSPRIRSSPSPVPPSTLAPAQPATQSLERLRAVAAYAR